MTVTVQAEENMTGAGENDEMEKANGVTQGATCVSTPSEWAWVKKRAILHTYCLLESAL